MTFHNENTVLTYKRPNYYYVLCPELETFIHGGVKHRSLSVQRRFTGGAGASPHVMRLGDFYSVTERYASKQHITVNVLALRAGYQASGPRHFLFPIPHLFQHGENPLVWKGL